MKRLSVFLIVVWTVPLFLLAAEVDTTRRVFQLELPLVPKTVAGPPKARTGLIWHTGPQVFYQGQAVSPPGKVNEPLAEKNLGTYTPIVSAPQTQQRAFPQKVVGEYTPIASAPQSLTQPPPQKALGQYTPVPGAPPPTAMLPPNYAVPFASPGPVPVGVRTQYTDVSFSEWSGGLNLSSFPQSLADNQCLQSSNFLLSPAGKVQPRPGFKFRKDKATNFGGANRITGLYNYKAPNGRSIVLAAIDGTLYADTNETGTYVSIKGDLESNSKYYDFATYKEKALVGHEGDYAFLWDLVDGYWKLGILDTGRVLFGDQWDHDSCELYTGGRCCARIVLPTKKWTGIDELAGYSLALYHSGAMELPQSFIYSSGATEHGNLFVLTAHSLYDSSEITGEKFWLLSQFNIVENIATDGAADTGTIDSVEIGTCPSAAAGSDIKIYDTGVCDYASTLYHEDYILRVTSGEYSGETRYIVDNGTDWISVPPHKTWNVGANLWADTAIYQTGVKFEIGRIDSYRPRLVAVFKNRIFLAGTGQKDSLGNNTIVFSEYNEPNNFPPDNVIHLNTDDAEQITALATFFDDQLGYKDQSRDCLVIFMQNSIWKLAWNSSSDYALVLVSPNVGCSAKNSVVNVQGKHFLFLHKTGIYAYDGRTVQKVSGLIQPIVDVMNEYIDMAAGGYHDDHYYLSYTDSANTDNRKTIALNTNFWSWWPVSKPWAGIFASQLLLDDSTDLIFSDYSTSTRIYEFDMATTDTGQAFEVSLQSKAFDFNSLQDDKVFSYFDLDYYLVSGSLDVAFYTDFGNTLKYDTTVTQAGGYETVRLPLASDCIGRNLSFKISSSSALELGKASLEYKKLED